MIDPPADPKNRDRQPNPEDPAVVDIYYVLEDSPELPPKEQVDLQLNIDKLLRAVQRLYMKTTPAQENKFRIYYVRLFRIAQLGLEGDNAVPEVATGVLAAVTADLIDDEAGFIKNSHLKNLGGFVALYSIVCLSLYATVQLFSRNGEVASLAAMGMDTVMLSMLLILWVGCFIGVWLSYGIRTTSFSLADLTTRDQDRLEPHIRLLFAGLLSMIIGLLCALGFIKVEIGNIEITNIMNNPMQALILGLFCGISELALPSSIGTRAHNLVASLK
jgi:hypothetical protein